MVGATDETDNIANFSSTGFEVGIVAPGTNIYSTYIVNNYSYMSGTSMAAPHVTGVAALVWAKWPKLTNVQLRNKLDQKAIDLGSPVRDPVNGFGLVNAKLATN